jgi:DNA-directed RNA polymerase subunit N (RpoN/RPB10)
MLKEKTVEVVINNTMIKWYRSKGYEIPVEEVQLYCTNKKGERIKNGKKTRVVAGTKIVVNVEDLPPQSNEQVTVICEQCGKEYTTTYQFYKNKKTNKCSECQKKTLKDTGSHRYWLDKLIVNNPNAKCDISGETDKRFLVLHHLLSRSNGGKDEESNYVILSANYHMAFHSSVGGTGSGCTPEQYYQFKEVQ